MQVGIQLFNMANVFGKFCFFNKDMSTSSIDMSFSNGNWGSWSVIQANKRSNQTHALAHNDFVSVEGIPLLVN